MGFKLIQFISVTAENIYILANIGYKGYSLNQFQRFLLVIFIYFGQLKRTGPKVFAMVSNLLIYSRNFSQTLIKIDWDNVLFYRWKRCYYNKKQYKIMEPQNELPHTLCPKCNNFIITSNFLIHQARCKGNNRQSSTFRNSRISNIRRSSNDRQSNTNVEQAQEQRIPCPFCGYGQTLKQLDTHPNACPHREIECTQCHLKFPLSLMEQHEIVCSARPNRAQSVSPNNQQNRPNNQQPQRNQPQRQQRRQPQRQQAQRPRNENSPIREQSESDEDDYENYRRQFVRVIDGNRRRQAEDPFDIARIMMGGMQGLRPSNPFERERRVIMIDPGALIALLARRARQTGETGLSKQQIKKFPITKYRNHETKTQDEDMCAICYCNFQENEQCLNLPCKHKFHPECIGKWLQKNPTCPLCKKNFKPNGNQHRQRERAGNQFGNVIVFNRVHLP